METLDSWQYLVGSLYDDVLSVHLEILMKCILATPHYS